MLCTLSEDLAAAARNRVETYLAPQAISESGNDLHVGVVLQLVMVEG